MLECVLALSLCLTPGQDPTSPPTKSPAKAPEKAPVQAPGKAPVQPPAQQSDKPPPEELSPEQKALVEKFKANLAFLRPQDNYIIREIKGGGRGGRTVSERRTNGLYTRNATKKGDGGEVVMVTTPESHFTIEKPAGKTEWQLVNQGGLDRSLKDSILSAQKPLLGLPMHYLDMRYTIAGTRTRFIVLDELTRHEELVARVTKEQENGKTLYRFHLNIADGDGYIDADPDMKWAVVKMHLKNGAGQENEYLCEYSGLVYGTPALKHYVHRSRTGGSGNWRTVTDDEYSTVATTDVVKDDYTLEHYGIKAPEQPLNYWTIGIIAWAGVTVLLVLWYLVAKRRKPTQATLAAPTA